MDYQSQVALENSKLILQLNQEGDHRWGGLKHSDLAAYIDKLVALQLDKSLPVCILIIRGLHPEMRESVESVLKEKKFKVPTQVRVYFLDGGELSAQYAAKKPDTTNFN